MLIKYQEYEYYVSFSLWIFCRRWQTSFLITQQMVAGLTAVAFLSISCGNFVMRR